MQKSNVIINFGLGVLIKKNQTPAGQKHTKKTNYGTQFYYSQVVDHPVTDRWKRSQNTK